MSVSSTALDPRFATRPSVRLRPWQRAAFDRFTASTQPDYLAVATPGAGKTTFALTCARWALGQERRRLIVVAPTSHLKTQWAHAAHRLGLQLDPDWTPTGGLARDVHGLVTTYQHVATAGTAKVMRGLADDAFVILDEIHHAGDERAWGDAIKHAFEPAGATPGPERYPVPQRHRGHPVRALRRARRRRHGQQRLHLRLRRRPARRRRRAPRLLPPHRRRDGVERTRRQRHQRQLPRRARQGPDGAPAAHRAQPRRRLAARRAAPGPRQADRHPHHASPTPAAW